MKKKIAKLRLNRETLRRLDGAPLRRVVGATVDNCSGNTTCQSDLGNCISDLVPGMCNPSVDSECVSRCVACPDTGGQSLDCSLAC